MKSVKAKYFTIPFILLSPVIFTFMVFKLINLRSACVTEKRKIAKTINEIQKLKSEYNDLQIKYYSTVKPETVDNMTKRMKILKENEVYYIE
ncbi:hypothetical protein [Desulfurobacterium atlanticum]|uniref:Septum formation initiator n=1 Tax=Desulfurobacterium atlanticum TaxID=240169 RepID=A0A239AB94_9BACT|nr:hypothetical protein [Desulfurobacterium atlanticum]SNR92860.1 hypothetical protein SAMN06265340_11820 [Desulfurobacterium atlanticum]